MKFSIEKQALNHALGRVLPIVAKRTTIPILSNVFLGVADGQLTIRATNTAMEASVIAPLTRCESEGAVCVSAATLAGIGKNAPDEGDISFSLGKRLTVKCGKSVFNLAALPAEDFPTFEQFTPSATLALTGSIFCDLVGYVAYAQSREKGKYMLHGVNLSSTGSAVFACATDSRIMGVIEIAMNVPDFNVIVPSEAVAEFLKITPDENDVAVRLSKEKIQVGINNFVLTSRLVDAKYPDFRRIVPKENHHIFRIGADAFLASIKRVSAMSNEQIKSVLFSGQDGIATLSVKGAEGDAVDEIEVEHSGKKIEMRFNAEYLSDTISAAKSDIVSFAFKDGSSPILVTGEDARFQAVLMGLRS